MLAQHFETHVLAPELKFERVQMLPAQILRRVPSKRVLGVAVLRNLWQARAIPREPKDALGLVEILACCTYGLDKKVSAIPPDTIAGGGGIPAHVLR